MKINKITLLMITMILCVGILSGCQNKEAVEDNIQKYKIVCTTFPQYDWVQEIIKGKEDLYEVTLLLDSGTDLHSYQPTAQDVAMIGTADLFIYVGGESDAWVLDAQKEATNKNLLSINLLETLGEQAKEEVVVEGMQSEEHHHHDEEEAEEEEHHHDEEEAEGEEHHHHDEEEIEYDEHVWLSLKNAIDYVGVIEEKLCQLDNENSKVYEANADAYKAQLLTLDEEYEKVIKEATHNTILFGDRFPFRYLVDDYGLKYYAAFVGCSAETEASFETITFLANKVDEEHLPYVLTIENSDDKIANTIIQNTKNKDQKVLVMNSLQSVTSSDIEEGFHYLNAMQENLEVLKKAIQ